MVVRCRRVKARSKTLLSREKEKLHRKEKLQIAAAAVRSSGRQVVILVAAPDHGNARALRNFQNLTIITNAVNIAAELSGSAVEVILTGGNLRKNSFSLVGPIAERRSTSSTLTSFFSGLTDSMCSMD